ncbi:putative Late nodulin [Medicago truncatula]|uniref:Nodule Cysteine-Rich (NCR) secreted peptide n=1 Tax=Medicago truncatula TaxID=3880 RepID=A0A072VBA6_MEDTR|nr:Nodule Cysteine-Rich (NCR) secreted peptide [Medicago truncatula]RHN75089.1 putative Late nodulin [Medicago truncatula]
MAKFMTFVYVMIYFLSLFLVTKGAYFECHSDSACETTVKCVLPRIPRCIKYKCLCGNGVGKRWSTTPKRIEKGSTVRNGFLH